QAVVPARRNAVPLIASAVAAMLVIAAAGVMWATLKKPVALPLPGVQTSAVVAAPPSAPAASTPATSSPSASALAPVVSPPVANGSSQPGLPPGIKLGAVIPNVALRGSPYRIFEVS